jgi:ketosteroid isomerase-like protein
MDPRPVGAERRGAVLIDVVIVDPPPRRERSASEADPERTAASGTLRPATGEGARPRPRGRWAMTDRRVESTTERRDTAEVMERFLELMPSDVLRAVEETAADDLVWWFPESMSGGEIWRSKEEALQRLLETHKKNFEHGTMAISTRRVTLVSDHAGVAELDLVARTTSGKDYDNTYVFVFTFDEHGLIDSIREHMDSKRTVDIMRS